MSDRYATANSLLRAAQELGLNEASFHQLPGWRAPDLLDRIFDAFTLEGRGGRMRRWIWADLREPSAHLQGKHEPSLLHVLGPPDTRVWLVAEDFGGKQGAPLWIFEGTIAAVAAALSNHHLVEFSVVSRSLEWLVGENHHDVWFASGEHAVAAFQTFMRTAAFERRDS